MKKLLAILLSLGLSCSLLTSCSKDDKSADKEETKQEETKKEETSAATELEEWLDANSADIESQIAAYEQQGITLDVVAEGNSLVYECTMPVDSDSITDEVIDAMAESMDAQEATFKSALKMIQSEIPSAESIIFEYYTQDGELIYEAEIK